MTTMSTVDGLDADEDDDFNDGPSAALLALRHGTAPTADRALLWLLLLSDPSESELNENECLQHIEELNEMSKSQDGGVAGV